MGKRKKKAGMNSSIHFENWIAYYENLEVLLKRDLNYDSNHRLEELQALDDYPTWADKWYRPAHRGSDGLKSAMGVSDVLVQVLMDKTVVNEVVIKFGEVVRALNTQNVHTVTQEDLYGLLRNAINESSYKEPSPEEFKNIVAGARSTMLSYFHFGQFLKHGKRVFKLSENLGRIFADMECKYPVSLLKTPFRSQYIQLPRNLRVNISTEMAESDLEGDRTVVIDGAYIHHNPEDNYVDILLTEAFNSQRYYGSIVEFFEAVLDERATSGTIIRCGFSLDEEGTLEDVSIRILSDTEGKYNGLEVEALRMMFHTLLYATSVNIMAKDVEPKLSDSAPLRDYRRNLDKVATNIPYVELGGDIKILPPGSSSSPKGTGRTLNARFMVRGHYSHYWYLKENVGKNEPVISINEDGSKVMIRKFLEPYWKGPDTAEKVLRDYVI